MTEQGAAELDESFVPEVSPHAVAAGIDGEAVVVHRRSGDVHHLNATSAVIWNCLDGRAPVSELIDDICDVYGADRSVVAADVIDVVRRFALMGLLDANEVVPADAEEAHPSPRYVEVPPNR